jgi:hypothetical protein
LLGSFITGFWDPRIQMTSDCQVVVKNYHAGTKGAYVHIVLEIKDRRPEFQEFSMVFEGPFFK